MSEILYVTKEGLENLQAELQNLKDVKRIEIAEKLKEAISYGDLRENSEYEEARNEQAYVEKRIADLEEQLKNVSIIEEEVKKKESKIQIGSLVTIENKGSQEKLKIVGITEANIMAEPPRVSHESPIGKALIGRKKWDKIQVKSQAGVAEYAVVSFE